MSRLPETAKTPLVRTDYVHPEIWQQLVAAILQPSPDGFLASVDVVENPALADIDPAQLLADARQSARHSLVIFADAATLSHPATPLLCMDVSSARSVRTVPSELWSIENNLSLGNMDFDEFVNGAGPDGIFRGF